MNCCVECEIDLAIAALEAPRSSESPDPYTGKGPALRGRQIRAARRPVACLSNVVRPGSGIHGHHGFNCALPCRGGRCDCQPAEPEHVPDLRTSGRGITYDLAQILGEP